MTADDFRRFDHIVALDPNNLRDLERLRPVDGKARLSLLLDHVEGRRGQAVADPYYGDDSHFDAAWDEVSAGAEALARRIAAGG